MNFAIPLSAHTFVNAAVNVVFPWSTCPIVPTFTCGFFRSNFAFAINHSFFKNPEVLFRRAQLMSAPGRASYLYSWRNSTYPRPFDRGRGPTEPWCGAHDADRTRDLVLTKDVLYQLSYVGSPHHSCAAICFFVEKKFSDISARLDV